eukprot:Hpha_TRINITY_DN16404_c5_g3::TRINITY_DN16404_c5_g3_i1::g.161009::m.161009
MRAKGDRWWGRGSGGGGGGGGEHARNHTSDARGGKVGRRAAWEGDGQKVEGSYVRRFEASCPQLGIRGGTEGQPAAFPRSATSGAASEPQKKEEVTYGRSATYAFSTRPTVSPLSPTRTHERGAEQQTSPQFTSIPRVGWGH